MNENHANPSPFPRRRGLGRPVACGAMLAALSMQVAAQLPDTSRGELLYTNHCVECHTTQVHWRLGRQARDWTGLKAQVQRWQDVAGLQWTQQDVEAVARHLNRTIYKFEPDKRVGLAPEPHGLRKVNAHAF